MFKIEGRKYYIEYEGLHKICSECGMYYGGRTTCYCTPYDAIVTGEARDYLTIGIPQTTGVEPTYGDWMVAKKRRRSARWAVGVSVGEVATRADRSITARSPPHTSVVGCRFQVLDSEPNDGQVKRVQDRPATKSTHAQNNWAATKKDKEVGRTFGWGISCFSKEK
ncbi:hypothetical protein LINGRAHAP2_LOCUS19862 [Linum grandiflorum]